MTYPIRFLLLFPTAFLLLALAGVPPHAEVHGIILDGRDGQAVPQAFVRLDGDVSQTRSDAYGRFVFAAVKPGKHLLEVLDPDYRSTRTEFSLAAGESKQFQITLKPCVYKQGTPDTETH